MMGRLNSQSKTQVAPESFSPTRTFLSLFFQSFCHDTISVQLAPCRKIHILGSFQNIKIARDAIVSLILGSPPGKVYAGLRTVASRMRQRAL